MATDEEKTKLAKLLNGLEVPEVKLTERCSDLVKLFHEKFNKEVEEEAMREKDQNPDEVYENPYKVDRTLLEENDRKLSDLLADCKRIKKAFSDSVVLTGADPKRPWRTHSNKEKLLRIDNELKHHHEKAAQAITPLQEAALGELLQECREEGRGAALVAPDRLRDTVAAAKQNLPNFQYRKIENATATAILPDAHEPVTKNVSSGQYIPRPPSRQCFLRSLGALRNLRVLALEYAHVADCSGGALLALLPVLTRPHMRLQLICREEHIPGRTDAALGAGGYTIPDTAWRRVAVACPDLYLFMAFCRVRDYDNIRRFLTPSIPLREAHVALGVDLEPAQRQDPDVSCLVRHLAFRYASSLCTLSIHQWRSAHFPLRRVFELMPRLVRFHYVGRVQDEVDLKRMLQIVACGVCHKLKHLKIQIQDEEARRDYWKSAVKSLSEEFIDVMDLYEINFCISIYKS